jgi:hypothetical protein
MYLTPVERLFLRAKHWQIFLLLVAPVVFWQIAIGNALPNSAHPAPQEIEKAFRIIFIATGASMLVFMGWLWPIGSFLNSIAPKVYRPQLRLFHLALIYPSAYAVALFIALSLTGRVSPLVLPFHLVATFCMFYDLYFVSKSLVLAERNKPVSFRDFSGSFFLLWFYLVGVWAIQPRVNRLFSNAGTGSSDLSKLN